MDLERPTASPLAVVAVGALALFGLVMLVQWVIGAIFGLVKLALVIVVAVAVIGVLVGRKADA